MNMITNGSGLSDTIELSMERFNPKQSVRRDRRNNLHCNWNRWKYDYYDEKEVIDEIMMWAKPFESDQKVYMDYEYFILFTDCGGQGHD